MLGQGAIVSANDTYQCEFHARTFNLHKLNQFIDNNVTNETIMNIRALTFVQSNYLAIGLIANGQDIWQSTNATLRKFKTDYLHIYSALPTNTQFTERGVKESGLVSLGRRQESNRSILAMARGRIIPDALQKGREDLEDDENTKQLQGKRKTKVLMESVFAHNSKMENIKNACENEEEYKQKRRRILHSLTKPNVQFKKERIDKKMNVMIQRYNNTPAPNVYERRTGETLTPLLQGRIQFHKMKKADNMDAVRNELIARGLQDRFTQNTNWTDLLKILKEDEEDVRFFTPVTEYDSFKWGAELEE